MDICGVSFQSCPTILRVRTNEDVDDTMCSDDPNTIIIKTDAVNGISDLVLQDGVGSVVVEAGVTFPQVYARFLMNHCDTLIFSALIGSTLEVPH